ncbi:helix-turn-helix transcriptional regulator [Rhodalgimonas zhirmunskyi]|uniref:LuxR family transcriptional regulator n=1 Tax=Rhodalgimonas zhirmunskyi TaxID=2964767 RepID=A0AAJ1UAQ8_9RHOB|nr:LuxR family transcriptional regulator [Rhodoalgimonas zhirmunskyi]MDQ2092792.1 LuxR family transcriptional regulator [Rhodoalgimonas zhirmunskyi]
MALVDYLDEITNAPSIEVLWDLHARKMADYGFTRVLYGYTSYRSATSLGDPDDFIILTNHDKEYTDWFLGKKMFYEAPMAKWALQNEGWMSWGVLRDMLETGALSEAQMKILEYNRKVGVTCGYTVSFKSVSPRSKGAIALTGHPDMTQEEADAVWAEHGPDIVVMNNVAHLKILSLPYISPERGLTKRQLEALHWVGDGKTTADIALLMGLTPATVEKHLRLARDVLNVETTAQAVLKAALHNQMFVVAY